MNSLDILNLERESECNLINIKWFILLMLRQYIRRPFKKYFFDAAACKYNLLHMIIFKGLP